LDSVLNAYDSKSSAAKLTQNWTQDENTLVRLVYVLTLLDSSEGTTSGFSHEGCK